MTTNKEKITLYLDPPLLATLETEAEKQRRTVSNYVSIILDTYFTSGGKRRAVIA